MMHIFVVKDPQSLQQSQFEFDLIGTDYGQLRQQVFAKLDQLNITGNFPVKVVTNYGSKVWMVQHSIDGKFNINNRQFDGDAEGWRQLQRSSPLTCLLMDERGEIGIDIDGCSAEFAIKLLNDGHVIRVDHPISYRQSNSYNIVYEL